MSSRAYQLKKNRGVPFITFPAFNDIPFIRHGFSTRLGGVSTGCLSSMNLSYGRGDITENVTENYRRICNAIGLDTRNLVMSDQVHDTVVYRAGENDRQGEVLSEKKLCGIDGLITDRPDVVLVTAYADCVPLFLVDRKKKAIGLSHSGWKGTAGQIGKKTVEAMTREYGTCPEDITAVIGPSICRDCYEVSGDVADTFRTSLGSSIGNAVLLDKGRGRYQLDLWKANQLILEEAGIPLTNISISGLCTCGHSDLLYSHRASRGQRGNLCGFLSILP